MSRSKRFLKHSFIATLLLFSHHSFSHDLQKFKSQQSSKHIQLNSTDKNLRNLCYVETVENYNTVSYQVIKDINKIALLNQGNNLKNIDFGAMILNFEDEIQQVLSSQDNLLFTTLATDKLLNDKLWLFSNNQGSTFNKIEEINKVQSFALHISETYKIDLKEAEDIVYHSFIESKERNIDPLLLISIISVESTFQKRAKSYAGAVGLTQVMANIHRDRIKKNNINIWSIEGNIQTGADIFHEYLSLSNGNIHNALQRYNGSLKDKSKKYSKKVFRKYNDYKRIYALNN